MFHESIQSRQNPRVKNLVKLREAAHRREQGLFLVEGQREIARAVAAGRALESLYVCAACLRCEGALALAEEVAGRGVPVFEVSEGVFEKVSLRQGPDGLLAVVRVWDTALDRVLPANASLVLVVESIEKPGNLGALIRTAEAAGVDALVAADTATDIFNPNVVRASQGLLFHLPIAVCRARDALDCLQQRQFAIVAATLQGAVSPWSCAMDKPTALVMGSEKDGLSPLWLQAGTQRVLIPMRGQGDSLNVSAAAAVLLYEAVRQRTAASSLR